MDLPSNLKTRLDYARSKDQKFYVTEDEHTVLRDLITPLSRSTVELWEGVEVSISEKLAQRQEANSRKS